MWNNLDKKGLISIKIYSRLNNPTTTWLKWQIKNLSGPFVYVILQLISFRAKYRLRIVILRFLTRFYSPLESLSFLAVNQEGAGAFSQSRKLFPPRIVDCKLCVGFSTSDIVNAVCVTCDLWFCVRCSRIPLLKSTASLLWFHSYWLIDYKKWVCLKMPTKKTLRRGFAAFVPISISTKTQPMKLGETMNLFPQTTLLR